MRHSVANFKVTDISPTQTVQNVQCKNFLSYAWQWYIQIRASPANRVLGKNTTAPNTVANSSIAKKICLTLLTVVNFIFYPCLDYSIDRVQHSNDSIHVTCHCRNRVDF